MQEVSHEMALMTVLKALHATRAIAEERQFKAKIPGYEKHEKQRNEIMAEALQTIKNLQDIKREKRAEQAEIKNTTESP